MGKGKAETPRSIEVAVPAAVYDEIEACWQRTRAAESLRRVSRNEVVLRLIVAGLAAERAADEDVENSPQQLARRSLAGEISPREVSERIVEGAKRRGR